MSLKENAISGVKWTTIATIITTIVGILRISILTRVLDKADFGIVAIISFVLGLTQMFADLGFSSALMHVKDLTKKQFSSLYWIQLFIFLSFYFLICCLSPSISNYYNEPVLDRLMPIALLDLLLNGIGRLYGTLIQKEFKFKIIAIRNIISALASLIVAIVLAIMGFGVYSLVLSTLSQTLIINVWNFLAGQSEIRIIFCVSLTEVKSLFKIGIFQTLTGIIDYVGGRLDVLIIGKMLGTEELGVFSICKELIIKVYTLINNVANNVTLPVFAKIQDEKEKLKLTYCRVLRGLSFISFPVLVTMAVLGEPLVTVVYGDKFIGTGLLFSILVISYLPACVVNPVGPLSIALGRTDLSFYYTLVKLVVTVPLVYITAHINLVSVAIAFVIISSVSFILSFVMMIRKYTGLSIYDYCSSFSKNAAYSLVISCFSLLLLMINPFHFTTAYSILLVYGTITGLLFIISAIFLIKNDPELMSLIPSGIKHYIYRKGC